MLISVFERQRNIVDLNQNGRKNLKNNVGNLIISHALYNSDEAIAVFVSHLCENI